MISYYEYKYLLTYNISILFENCETRKNEIYILWVAWNEHNLYFMKVKNIPCKVTRLRTARWIKESVS